MERRDMSMLKMMANPAVEASILGSDTTDAAK